MRSVGRNLAIAVLAMALLAFFLRQADLASVWREIRQADRGLLLVAAVSIFVNMALRAVRWQYLLAPVGHAGFANAFRTTLIGFAASYLLPARAGEFLRPYLLARREGFSATATFATVVLERVLDLLAIVFFLAGFVLIFDPGMAAQNAAVYDAARVGGLVGGVVGVTLLGSMVMLAGRPEAVVGAALRLERVMPARAARAIARLAGLFAEGLAAARDPRRLLISLAWSAPLWLSIAFGIWTASLAFEIEIPFTGAFLITALLAVGSAVPTPAAVGGFHEAFRIGATAFYAVPNDRAVGAAIVLHAVSVVPVTIVGLLLFVREGFTVTSLGQLSTTAKAEDKPGEVPVLRASRR